MLIVLLQMKNGNKEEQGGTEFYNNLYRSLYPSENFNININFRKCKVNILKQIIIKSYTRLRGFGGGSEKIFYEPERIKGL